MKHIAKARAAVGVAEAAAAVAEAAKRKMSELRRLERSEQLERERLREQEDEAEALRQLDGDQAAPVDAERAKRLAALDKAVPARSAAIRLQEGRVAAAEKELRQARAALAAPALHVIADLQQEAAEAIRSIAAQLAPHFAKLLASDQIRVALLGDRFPVPEGCPAPLGGGAIVNAFGKAVPVRLKPAELDPSLLAPAASAVAAEILTQIEGR